MKRTTKSIPKELRREVMKRDGWQCLVCGDERQERLDLHHLIHRSQGGKDDFYNLVTLCRHCHELVHEEDQETIECLWDTLAEMSMEFYHCTFGYFGND
jgi:5-methylcytosine-specific restriction endonuclease McrA